MTTPNPKARNGVGGWIAIAMLCGGASGGATYLRPPPSHNPDITTADWITMKQDVKYLREVALTHGLKLDVIITRLPQQQLQPPP